MKIFEIDDELRADYESANIDCSVEYDNFCANIFTAADLPDEQIVIQYCYDNNDAEAKEVIVNSLEELEEKINELVLK